MAWLNTAPKPPEGSKRAQTQRGQPAVTRLERLKRDRIPPQMPPNPAPHIIDRLVEMGLTESAGMGPVPLSWREIDAWCNRTHVDLPPWEARLISKLSRAYLAETRRAESEMAFPPYRNAVTHREIETEDARLRALLG